MDLLKSLFDQQKTHIHIKYKHIFDLSLELCSFEFYEIFFEIGSNLFEMKSITNS